MIDNDHPWTTPQDYIDEARKRNRRGFFVGIDELGMFQGHIAEAEARAGRWKVFARALGELNADLLSGPIDGSEAQATFQRKREQVWAAESDLYQHGDLPDTAGEGSEA